MQNTIVKILFLVLLSGCTLSSRETFELSYQDKFIMSTLDRDLVNNSKSNSLKTISEDGVFNQDNHDTWDFDADTMEVSISSLSPEGQTPIDLYAVEIVQDLNVFEGVLRLYGDGVYNGKYIGVKALTNKDGVYAKFSIQDLPDNALENAKAQPFYKYVSEPIIFRIHRQYVEQEIVSLDNEEFFDEQNHNYYIPKVGYILEHYIVSTSGGITSTNQQPNITLKSTTVIPLDLEIYRVEGSHENYLAVIFKNELDRNKMKFAFAGSHDEAVAKVKALATFTYELKETADRPNKVIKAINGYPLVLLSRLDIDGMKIGVGELDRGEYFWENTEQFIFNSDEMTLDVISTLSPTHYNPPDFRAVGITNRASYSLKMLRDKGDREGIFKITGDRLLNNRIVGIRVNKIEVGDQGLTDPPRNPADPTPKYRADFIFHNPLDTPLLTLEQSIINMELALANLMRDPKWKYQDIYTSLRPYRLAENLDLIGDEWVILTDDNTGSMAYDPRNTEVFQFITHGRIGDRGLKYTSFVNGSGVVSYYKMLVAFDSTDTNGVFQLIGFDGAEFQNVDPTRPLHNKFVAINKGADIYKAQAKLAKGNTLEEALLGLREVTLFNLYEKSGLPSALRVINQMIRFDPWVAVKYGDNPPGDPVIANNDPLVPGYSTSDTVEYDFDTSGVPQVQVRSITGATTNMVTYAFITEDTIDVSSTRGIYRFTRLSGTGEPNLASGVMGIHIGVGNENNRAFFAFEANKDAVITTLNSYVKKGRYTHYSQESAPVAATVLTEIQGKQYIQYNTNTPIPGSVFPVPNGIVVPHLTSYFTFNHETLLMKVVRYTGDTVGIPTAEEYHIIMREDGGIYDGIFRVEGSGIYNGQFIRLSVQKGSTTPENAGEAEANKIRMLIADNQDALKDSKPGVSVVNSLLNVDETSLQEYGTVVATFEKTALQAFYNVGLTGGGLWASVDIVDKKYDSRNNKTVRLTDPTTSLQITIEDHVKESIQRTSYDLEIMENIISGSDYGFVAKLIGTDSLRGQYIAITNAVPTTVENSGITASVGHRIVIARSFNLAKNGLIGVVPPDAFVQPTVLSPAMLDVLDRDYKQGTPSFVYIKDGVYDREDTEEWRFTINDTGITNLTVIHETTKNESVYNIYMEHADVFVPSGGTGGSRGSSLFYVRSGNTADVYDRKYVHIEDLTIDDSFTPMRTAFNATIDDDRNVALASAVKREMRDIGSVSILAGAVGIAATSSPWVRVANNNPHANDSFQFNRQNTEEWNFNASASEISVIKTERGVAQPVVTYKYRAIENESSSSAVIQLFGTGTGTAGEYADKFVAFSLAGDSSINVADKKSMKLHIADDVASVKTGRNNLIEWNFRTKEIAELSFINLHMVDLAGIVKLKETAGEYAYDSTDTERILFRALDPSIENLLNSTVLDILISRDNSLPADPAERYGMKLLESAGFRFAFQIFRRDDSSLGDNARTNTFVQLELGRNLNEGLIRIGEGNSLINAKNEFNELGDKFNWSAHSRAESDFGVYDRMGRVGQWTLQRHSSLAAEINKITGSASFADSAGHLVVDANGVGKPKFVPDNTLNAGFDLGNKTITIRNFRSAADLLPTAVPATFNYGLTSTETISEIEGIYEMTGFGDFNGNFVYLAMAEEADGTFNRGKRGKMAISPNLSDPTTGLRAMIVTLNAHGKFNLFSTDWTKQSAAFIVAAGGLNELVTIDLDASVFDTSIAVLDARNTTAWLFDGTGLDPKVRVSLIVNGVVSVQEYNLISQYDATNEGVFSVSGEGVLDGRIFAMSINATAHNITLRDYGIPTGGVTQDALIDQAKTELEGAYTGSGSGGETMMFARDEIVENYDLDVTVDAQDDNLVMLDQDNIYLAHEALVYTFNVTAKTVDISVPVERDQSVFLNRSTYFLNPIKGATVVAGSKRAIYLLKGSKTSDPYHNNLLAITVLTSPSSDGKKLYGQVILTNTQAADTGLSIVELNTLIGNSTLNSIALEKSVTFDDSALDDMERSSGWEGLGLLHLFDFNFNYNPLETERIIFDAKNRVVLYVLVSSTAANSSTNFMRMDIIRRVDTVNGHFPDFPVVMGKGITIKLKNNTRTDIDFRGEADVKTVASETAADLTSTIIPSITAVGGTSHKNNFHMAFAVPQTPNITGVYLGVTKNIGTAENWRTTSKDPKLVPISILNNEPQVLKSMRDHLGGSSDRAWYIPITSLGVIDTDPTRFALRPLDNILSSTPQVYNLRFGTVDSAGVVTTPSSYLTKVIQNRGDNAGTFIPHGVRETVYKERVSNKYISFIYGTVENETKLKVAVGDNQREADLAINDLVFWNYTTKKVLDADATLITNLDSITSGTPAVIQKLTWVQYPSPGIATPPVYDSKGATNWSFESDTSGGNFLSVNVNIITDEISRNFFYRISLIDKISDRSLIFQLSGAGSLDKKFVYVDNSIAGNETAKIAIANTIVAVTADMEAITDPNFYRQDRITMIGAVMDEILSRGDKSSYSVTSYFDPPTDAFYINKRDTWNHFFYLSSEGSLMMDVETLSSSVNRKDSYYLEFLEQDSDSTAERAIYTMKGLGGTELEHNHFMAIRFDDIDNARFKLIVGGRDASRFHDSLTGLIPNTRLGVKDFIVNAMNLAMLREGRPENEAPLKKWETMRSVGDLGIVGVFDTNQSHILDVNVTDRELRIIIKDSRGQRTLKYNIIIVEDFDSEGNIAVNPTTPSDKISVIRLLGLDATSIAETKYHNRHLAFEIIDDTRIVAGFGSENPAAIAALNIIKGKERTHPFGYWTYEQIDRINSDQSIVKTLQGLAAERTIMNTVDSTISTDIDLKSVKGLAFMADVRLFKNALTSTSRIKTTTSTVDNGSWSPSGDAKTKGAPGALGVLGGYYDPNDTYHLDFDTSLFNEVSISRIGASGAVAKTLKYRIKVLQSSSDSSIAVIQLLAGVGIDGLAYTDTDTELDVLFKNRVLAIDIGKSGINTDNIQVGYATPSSSSQADMDIAILAARADLRTDLNIYTPNIVPLALAIEEKRIYKILYFRETLKPNFSPINRDGVEFLDPLFTHNNELLSGKILSGNDDAWGVKENDFTFIAGLKSATDVNGNHSTESRVTETTSYMIRMIQNVGPNTGIFKFYRPNTITTKLTTQTAWSNIMLNKYHAMVQGVGANLFTYKWAYGDSVVIAQAAATSLPFYNGANIWASTDSRRVGLMRLPHLLGATNGTKSVWVQKNGLEGNDQALPSGVHLRNFRFKNYGKTYLVEVVELNSDMKEITRITYPIYLKDAPGITAIAISLGGAFGSLTDSFMYIRNLSEKTKTIKIHKTTVNSEFDQRITFIGGSTTVPSNIEVYADDPSKHFALDGTKHNW